MGRRVGKYGGRSLIDIGDWIARDGTRINAGDIIADITTPFANVHVANETPLLELKSIYGLSNLRDVQITAGSATITHTGPEFKLSTTASGSDSVTLETAERGRYVPGTTAVAGIGVRRPTAAAGSQDASWGAFDSNDGFYFGEDATGIYVARLIDGTETKIYQSDWNADTLDGSGSGENPSGLQLDLSDGNIFRINYSWYGYGTTSFNVLMENDRGRQVQVVVHRFTPEGAVSIEDPNLPISASVDNGGTATAFDLFVGGRQFSLIGEYEPNRRRTTERRLQQDSIATTFLPTVSFRKKADVSDGAQFQSVSAKVGRLNIITDSDIVWQIRTGVSLTDASFGTPTDHSASETAIEADTSATAVSGGEVIDQGLIVSGQGSARADALVDASDFDFIGNDIVSLLVRKVSGTGGTVSTVFGTREEW